MWLFCFFCKVIDEFLWLAWGNAVRDREAPSWVSKRQCSYREVVFKLLPICQKNVNVLRYGHTRYLSFCLCLSLPCQVINIKSSKFAACITTAGRHDFLVMELMLRAPGVHFMLRGQEDTRICLLWANVIKELFTQYWNSISNFGSPCWWSLIQEH